MTQEKEIQLGIDKQDRRYCGQPCPQLRLEYVGGDCYYCHCAFFGKLGWYPGPKRTKECLELTNEEHLWKDPEKPKKGRKKKC